MNLTVGLDANRVPDMNILERNVDIPSWTTSPADRVGVLVTEEMREEVVGPLEQVRNVILKRDLVYRQT